MLLLAYSSEGFSRNLPILFQGEGPPVALLAFLMPPTVTCDAARDALVLGADFTGTLTYAGTTGVETHPVIAHADVVVPPDFTLMAGQLALSPQHDRVKVVTWNFTVVGGGGFKPDTDAYLHSPLMLDRLSATVKLALDAKLLPLPSVDVSSLGPIVDASAPPPDTLALVPGRVVDGAVIVGLGVSGFVPPWPPDDTSGIWLTGDTSALENFAGGYDLAVATNPDALPILLASVEQQIVSAVGSGATIRGIGLTARDGEFGVNGMAVSDNGHATFSFSIVPHMDAVRPGGAIDYIEKPFAIPPQKYAGLWFSTENPKFDPSADLPLWEELLAGLFTVATAGGFLLYLLPFIERDGGREAERLSHGGARRHVGSTDEPCPSGLVAFARRRDPPDRDRRVLDQPRWHVHGPHDQARAEASGAHGPEVDPGGPALGEDHVLGAPPARCRTRRSVPPHPVDGHRPVHRDGPDRPGRAGEGGHDGPQDIRHHSEAARGGPGQVRSRMPRLPSERHADDRDLQRPDRPRGDARAGRAGLHPLGLRRPAALGTARPHDGASGTTRARRSRTATRRSTACSTAARTPPRCRGTSTT